MQITNVSLSVQWVWFPGQRYFIFSLHWSHNEGDSVSNRHPHDYLLNRLFSRRSKKTSQLDVTGLCVGNSPWTGEFHAQMASNAENVSIWWRHHVSMLPGKWRNVWDVLNDVSLDRSAITPVIAVRYHSQGTLVYTQSEAVLTEHVSAY